MYRFLPSHAGHARSARRLSLWLALSLLIAALPVARAAADEAPAEKFLSARGRFMAGGDISGGWSNDERTGFGAHTRWWININPTLIYFVRDRTGIGGWAGGGTGHHGLGSNQELSIGARALFDVPFSRALSLFVIPSLGFKRTWSYTEALGFAGDMPLLFQATTARNFVHFKVDLPLVFHCSPSVSIGLGPQLTLDVFVNESTNVIASGPSGPVIGSESGYRPEKVRVITGLSSFIGASF